MNWNDASARWQQLKGSVRKQWGKLTDDDVAEIKGDRDKLVGKLQERYGYERAKAEELVDGWAVTAV